MNMVGGDVGAMRQFAEQLRRRRANIEAVSRRLTRVVADANWVGPDRDAFLNEWQGQHIPQLTRVAECLGSEATRIDRHATDQERASR